MLAVNEGRDVTMAALSTRLVPFLQSALFQRIQIAGTARSLSSAKMAGIVEEDKVSKTWRVSARYRLATNRASDPSGFDPSGVGALQLARYRR